MSSGMLLKAGALALLIGFFIPAVSVSCTMPGPGGRTERVELIQMSIFNVAVGSEVDVRQLNQKHKVPADPKMWLVAIGAGLAGLASFAAGSTQLPSLIGVGVAGLSAFLLYSSWQDFKSQVNNTFVAVDFVLGAWLLGAGLLSLLLGGLLGLKSKQATLALERPKEGGD